MVLLFAWYIELIFVDSWIEQLCRIVKKWITVLFLLISLFFLPFVIPPMRATSQPQRIHLDFILLILLVNSVYYEGLSFL
jgi:hypothetical protein